MKAYLKLKITVTAFCLVFITSCDLDLQDNYRFVPEVDLSNPHDDKTAWKYIQTRTALNEDGTLNLRELNYMIAAIKRAGFEDLYDQTETTDRTYLLLANEAFIGGGNIINIITGTVKIPEGETPEDTMARVDTPEELEKLKTILRYHIVKAYVAQVPTLAETEVRYLFQTLIPGEDGLIVFSRTSRWTIQINRGPAPLPITATQGGNTETVVSHNYVFNNGIGHWIIDPVRNKPY